MVLLNTGTYYGRYELTSYDNARKASADLKGVYYYYHDEDHARVHRAVGHTVDRWTDREGWGGELSKHFGGTLAAFCSVTHLLVTAYGFIPFLSRYQVHTSRVLYSLLSCSYSHCASNKILYTGLEAFVMAFFAWVHLLRCWIGGSLFALPFIVNVVPVHRARGSGL